MRLFGVAPDPVAVEVEAVRQRLRGQGHALTPLQHGIVAAIAANAPDRADTATQLDAIRGALHENGRWHEADEWRIGTWFDSQIEQSERDGRPFYLGSVRCDGQSLSCEGPSLERVFAFVQLYRAVILEGFYAVGPPWAG